VQQGDFFQEAREFAYLNVRLTCHIKVYDDRERRAPTPEEYAAGLNEPYTLDTVTTENREYCTNYREILRQLDREGRDQAFHRAVYMRANEIVDEELDRRLAGKDE
jgi:hypothetical protein